MMSMSIGDRFGLYTGFCWSGTLCSENAFGIGPEDVFALVFGEVGVEDFAN